MASVFKRGRDENKKGACWWINYKDSTGKRRKKKGFTDKAKTYQLAAKLEADAQAIRDGLVDPATLIVADNRKRPIVEHVEAYRKYLERNKQTTKKHVNLVVGRIERTVLAAGFQSLTDMNHESVEAAIASMRDKAERLKVETGKGRGFGAKTYNHYLSGFESFGKWLYETHRVDINPFRGFQRMNAATDVRKKRRALTTVDLNQLLKAARESGVNVEGFDGETRARIYTVAALTGLRRSEIATLTPESFTGLESGSRAMLKVEAACSKHRREDNLPVHGTLVKQLSHWLIDAEHGEPLFPKLEKRKTFEMIEKDLTRAGIEYKNDDGDADFHALRHTFISQLFNVGATVMEAKELARHSDVNMTMRYSHVERTRQAEALAKLDFGTALGPNQCHPLTPNGKSIENEDCQNRDSDTKKATPDNDCHDVALIGSGGFNNTRAEDTGVEPATREGN